MAGAGGVAAPPGSRHLTEWSEPPVYDEDKLYDIIEELVAVSEDLGVSAAQVALAYTMAKPAVTSGLYEYQPKHVCLLQSLGPKDDTIVAE